MSFAALSVLGWLLDATLKGSVVILLVAVVQRLIARRVDARWRHALWLIVLLRLAVPIAPATSWSIFNLLPASDDEAVLEPRPAIGAFVMRATEPASDAGQLFPVDSLAMAWKWIAVIWIAGFVALLLRALISTLRVRIALRGAPDVALKCAVTLDDARRRLGINRAVRVVETNIVKAPALYGLIRPTLLLPIGLADSFDHRELRHIMFHELWHLRRLDVVVNWLLAAVQALHWFNPLVWFAVSRIQEERELACDELALSRLEEEERFGYGRTILKLLDRFRAAGPVPALVGIVNHKQKMKRRLIMIATFRNRSRFPILFLGAIVAIGAIGLTDARGGERKFLHKLDPAAVQTMERLDQRVSFDLTDGSFSDLLNTIANKAGVVVTQSPDIATSRVQQARFTLHAENVPAHAALMEALMPFELAAQPDANGVTVTSAPSCGLFMHQARGEGEPGVAAAGDKRIFIERTGAVECKMSEDGKKMHRELTLNIDENGVKSQGKLSIDVSCPQAK